ncbi:MAG: adenosylcobalamin-dependent ribonucleoside-diphosphate reductase [Candidatus Marinimicrobia bacterium]|nr:adenosylcobalamin-dependent ribonucleoside-diphosphate reductase [Candidatus Neomarinimicrobiota bacterium]MDA1363516.1 adenosylcobalamin-dependent ribonucleoside-diphosphate reductase [Candidatus Neomarinimicrobiota bacterium]
MAEAIEINFPTELDKNPKIDSELKNQILGFNVKESMDQGKESCPEEYTIDNYYKEDDLGRSVLEMKYLAPGEKNPWELWKRQAKALASVEKTPELQKKWEAAFFEALKNFKFVPGGRIMHGAGREDITTTLNNCYVVGIKDDSIKSIYDCIVQEAMTYKYGGGCGHDLSVLRPSGDEILGTGGNSCGPVGFMNLFSENTNTIAQHGRRGANMQTLRVDHPDIEKFIEIKTGDVDMVKYSNISVLLTDDFMDAVQSDSDYDLYWGGKIYTTVKAKELWMKIIEHAHASAEPGLLFWDTMTKYHNAEYCSPLVSTNPCAEQPLPDGGCCNLGALNLERFVDQDGNFDFDGFKETTAIGARFLDNVIDYNLDRHALEEQKQNAMNDRRVGLGILGLGDMLVKMGIKYDSDEALETIGKIMEIHRNTAYETSIDLAKEKGQFPNFDWDGYSQSLFIQDLPKELQTKIKNNGIRNCTLTTVAPTGSGAIVARVTSGVEPIFATSYKRKVKKNDSLGKEFDTFTVYHPVVQEMFGTDENLPEYVVTAHNVDPYFRVKMQGVVQRYIDSSISSTVNLAEETTVETVADIYMTAYKANLKGITVYREGSREGILITDEKSSENKEKKSQNTEMKTARNRPSITEGKTRRMRTGDGTLYVTVNEDENGLCEVFTAIGKAGGTVAAQTEAISRLISLALRSGVDPNSIINQLKGISGPNPTWEDGQLILSTPDAIGRALETFVNGDSPSQDKKGQFEIAEDSFTSQKLKGMFCKECEGHAIFDEGGCLVCKDCGWSKCE